MINNNNELGSRLRVLASFFGIGFASQKTCLEAADALEAQARENALIKDEALTWKICYERTSDAAQDLELIRNELTVERDGLRKELAALQCGTKMVPLTLEQISDAIYKADAHHNREFMTDEWPVVFTRTIEAAHSITGEPK